MYANTSIRSFIKFITVSMFEMFEYDIIVQRTQYEIVRALHYYYITIH